MKQVLTIAGSDSGAGAGIQADLKTFAANGVYGLSTIVAITAQNTKRVKSIFSLPENIVEDQLDVLFEDFDISAVKTGMLFSSNIIEIVSNIIKKYKVEKVVLDPVMISKSGNKLLEDSAIDTLVDKFIPLAYIITPNINEAERLLNIKISNLDDMYKAAEKLCSFGCKNVLVKGGHLNFSKAVDILFDGHNHYEFSSEMINSKNTHGTGCTYASAIAANLAKGYNTNLAIKYAKKYLTEAIVWAQSNKIGHGHGPLNHFCMLTNIK